MNNTQTYAHWCKTLARQHGFDHCGIARAHFTVRRLERRHGAALVRAAYDQLRLRPATA